MPSKSSRNSKKKQRSRPLFFVPALVFQFVSNPEQMPRNNRKDCQKAKDNGDTGPWVYRAHAKESITESVDHIKNGIEVRNGTQRRREHIDRIKHATQEAQWGNGKYWNQVHAVEVF